MAENKNMGGSGSSMDKSRDFDEQSRIFRGGSVDPGSIGFASGAMVNPSYSGPDFRVARMAVASATSLAEQSTARSTPRPPVRSKISMTFAGPAVKTTSHNLSFRAISSESINAFRPAAGLWKRRIV